MLTIETMDAAANSAGNAALKRILAHVEAAREELCQLIDAHPADCPCDWCQHGHHASGFDANGNDVQQSFQYAERALAHVHDDLWMLECRTFAEHQAVADAIEAKMVDKPAIAE